MADNSYLRYLNEAINFLKESGLYKGERVVTSPQQPMIQTTDGRTTINLCANNYLGLANHPEVIAAARKALEKDGFGMASVRFICGTHQDHKALEQKISLFLQTEDTLLYSSCFDANTGLFETLLQEEDAILSDALNHASIIDGIRLCKAKRFRYAHNDMNDLEINLQRSQACRYRLIATDGVFSMDGRLANLPRICELANQYNALVMVDDSHAVGFMGKEGRGTPEYFGVMNLIDIYTGTLGKALGGASGGYTSGRREIIEWLRQRSRPYLFSNTLAPVLAATTLFAFELIQSTPELREKLHFNSRYFREQLDKLGFSLISGDHPIIPILIGDAKLSATFAEELRFYEYLNG